MPGKDGAASEIVGVAWGFWKNMSKFPDFYERIRLKGPKVAVTKETRPAIRFILK